MAKSNGNCCRDTGNHRAYPASGGGTATWCVACGRAWRGERAPA